LWLLHSFVIEIIIIFSECFLFFNRFYFILSYFKISVRFRQRQKESEMIGKCFKMSETKGSAASNWSRWSDCFCSIKAIFLHILSFELDKSRLVSLLVVPQVNLSKWFLKSSNLQNRSKDHEVVNWGWVERFEESKKVTLLLFHLSQWAVKSQKKFNTRKKFNNQKKFSTRKK
jgi:hypothetical protein